MHVRTNEKQIQKLKARFPNLHVVKVNENVWYIEKAALTEKEEVDIQDFIKNNETRIIEKKEIIQMAEQNISQNQPVSSPTPTPVVQKSIGEITGSLSQAFSSLYGTILGQASMQITEIDKKIGALDAKIQESNKLLSSERGKMIEEQKVIVGRHVENLQKISDELKMQVNGVCSKVESEVNKTEKNILELAKKLDENHKELSEMIAKQKNKIAKIPDAIVSALKD